MGKHYTIALPDGRLGIIEIPLLAEKQNADLASITVEIEEANQLRALAKTQFELRRSALENPALSGQALENWRMNVRFDDYDGPPVSLPYRACSSEEIPADRTFREAWEDGGSAAGININMPKARAIHMDRIRKVRDVELAKLDTSFMVAIEKGDAVKQQKIAQQKQALRDLPQKFDLSAKKTPQELKAAWPDELPK